MANAPILAFGELYILQIARNYDANTALSDKMVNRNDSFRNKVRCTVAFADGMLTKHFGCPTAIEHISCKWKTVFTSPLTLVLRLDLLQVPLITLQCVVLAENLASFKLLAKSPNLNPCNIFMLYGM